MNYMLFSLWFLLGAMVIYSQLRWARGNYPATPKWFFIRFGSAFLNGAILGLWLFHKDYQDMQLAIAILLCGFAIGLLFTFVFRYNLQRVIPKQHLSVDEATQREKDSIRGRNGKT